MKRFAPLAVILVLLLVLGAAAVWAVQSDTDTLDDLLVDLDLKDAKAGTISGSGFIEAEQMTVAGEIGGRIAEVAVTEGVEVKRGDVLLRLEADTLVAQVRQAEAAVASAQAQLDRLRAGARPQEVRQAEAAVAGAEAARDGAQRAWQDALAILADPQQLDLRLDAARTALTIANQQVLGSEAALRAATAGKDQAEDLFDAASAAAAAGRATTAEVARARQQLDQAEDLLLVASTAVDTARVGLEGAGLHESNLQLMRDKPLELIAQVDAARSRYDVALAAVDAAVAQLALVRVGAPAAQLQLAEAGVRQAEAALRALEARRDMLTLRAPLAATVIEVIAHAGEDALPGAALLRLGKPSPVELTIFVGETDVGDLEVGQPVEVTVDAFADETFAGEVAFIASEAEFTPKNVQTKAERASLVFGVRVRLPNEDGVLKAGMPASAVIEID